MTKMPPIHQTDVTGKAIKYQYDLMNNTSEVWDNGRKITSYGYNAGSFLTLEILFMSILKILLKI